MGLKNGPNKIERDLFENRQKRMGFGIIGLDLLMNLFSVRFQIVLSLNRQYLRLSFFVSIILNTAGTQYTFGA